ncbi:MAG: 4'-phosphopantetheinyl transferase superfamily protein [Lachnospiraceae bacterium]|nr:4'-phosphopantetheinyl transferase superfamily protein [Lachnospiraceae bacterium]
MLTDVRWNSTREPEILICRYRRTDCREQQITETVRQYLALAPLLSAPAARILASMENVDPDHALDRCCRVDKTEDGKPYFPLLPLYISISDTETYRWIALSPENIGIDAEDSSRKARAAAISKRFFAAEEQEALKSGCFDFFTLWTEKESYVKYTGRGIRDDFASFSVFSIRESICSFTDPEGYRISVCTEKPMTLKYSIQEQN